MNDCSVQPSCKYVSNFAQFTDGLGVKSGIGALFHMNSALTAGQPVKCDFT